MTKQKSLTQVKTDFKENVTSSETTQTEINSLKEQLKESMKDSLKEQLKEEIRKELQEEMKKDITSAIKLSKLDNSEEVKEKKPEIRRAESDYRGRMYIKPQFKRDGFVTRVVSEANLEYMKSIGYQHCVNQIPTGDSLSSDPSHVGGHPTIEVGKNFGKRTDYIMECPKDIFDARQKDKVRENLSMLKSKIVENQKK